MTEYEALKALEAAVRGALERRKIGRGFVAITQDDKDAIHLALRALDAAEVVGVEECADAVRSRTGNPRPNKLAIRAVLRRIKGGSDDS